MPLLVLFTLIFTSCQKENIQKELRPISDKTALDKLKAFYKSETSTTSKNNAVASFRPDRGEPDWEKTMYAVEEGKYILPVQINKREINEDINANKYLVISEKEGKLTGFFYYAISKAKLKNSLQIGNVLTAINVFERKQQDLSKELGITKVGINDSQALSEKSVADENKTFNFIGYKLKRFDTKGTDENGGEIVNNYVEEESCTAGGGTVVEIEWYYQTYVNGVLVEEFYVFSTYECWGGSNGGGGGGGGPTTGCGTLTLEQVTTLVNSVSGQSENNISYNLGISMIDDETLAEEQLKSPKWGFLKMNFFLGYYVRYTAFFTGKRFKANQNDTWKWKNLQFSYFDKTEGALPPCMNDTYNGSATVAISFDKKKADANLSFTVNYVYTCFFGSHAGSYSTSQTNTFFAE